MLDHIKAQRAVKAESNLPLCVQFGGNAALIWCNDPVLRRLLGHHFRHGWANSASAVVTYQITVGADHKLQLRRDETLLYDGPSSNYIIERLLHDITITLTKQSQQHLVFHAAGLAYDETGLLLCGQSGSGKSTLAAWLTANGFDYLTDELVAISLDGGQMSGLARPIVLKKGSEFVWQQWLDEPAQACLTHLSNGTTLLDPESLRAHSIRTTAYPRILLFPRYADGQAFTIQPLSSAKAAFRLMHRLINAENLPNRGFAGVTRLAQQTDAYSITYHDITLATTWIKQTILTKEDLLSET